MSTKVQRGSAAAREARIDRWVDDVLTAIAKPTPTEAVEALVAEAGIHVEELDETLLDEKHRGQVQAFYVETGGKKVLCLPAGQTPDERLAAVRALLTHLGVIA